MSSFFVRGLSRSGGTLMATVLDAHPDVAMSYETYEHLLVPDDKEYRLGDILTKMRNDPLTSLKGFLFSNNSKSDSNFKKFVGRAERAGIDKKALSKLFGEHFESGLRLDTFADRMRLVERLTKKKMQRDRKKILGREDCFHL